MKLSLKPFKLKPRRALRAVPGELHERDGLRLELELDGAVGQGESSPLPAFGTETLEQCRAALESFQVPGPLESVEAINGALAHLSATPAARHGLEVALLDLLARQRGLPLYSLLGEPMRTELTSHKLIDGEDAKALAHDAAAAIEAGFQAVKVKVGTRPVEHDARRLLEVRRAVAGHRIRVDANARWSEADTRVALRGMQALDLELCEQPVRADDFDAMARLRGRVPGRLAADEALLIPDGWKKLLGQREDGIERPRAADVWVLKPMALGGLLPALEMARRGHAAGVDAYVTTLLDGPIARAAACHLAAVIPQQMAGGLATVELFDGVEPDAFTPVGGKIRMPSSPGLGWRPA